MLSKLYHVGLFWDAKLFVWVFDEVSICTFDSKKCNAMISRDPLTLYKITFKSTKRNLSFEYMETPTLFKFLNGGEMLKTNM